MHSPQKCVFALLLSIIDGVCWAPFRSGSQAADLVALLRKNGGSPTRKRDGLTL